MWIDILRGVAALQVVFFHMRVDLWVGFNEIHQNPQNYAWPERLLAWGGIPWAFGSGVMLFFVISGFCVHLPEARKDWPLEFKRYAIRRFFRIYPPYLAAVLLTILADLALARISGIDPAREMWAKAAAMLQNYSFSGYAWAGQWRTNPSLWSLPVEVELYLVYPIFFWLLRKIGGFVALLFVGIGSMLACALLQLKFPWLVGNFLMYWLIWCSGAWLAELYSSGRLPSWSGKWWIALAGSALLGVASTVKKWSPAVEAYAWAAFSWILFWWGLQNPRAVQRPENSVLRALAFVGTISYSLYLLHFPFFRISGAVWKEIFGTKPANLMVPFAFAFVAIFLAAIFYKWVEAPSHRLARQLARTPAKPPPTEKLNASVAP